MQETMGTRLHSWVTPKCLVRESSIDRWGVFAKESIAKGEVIALWGGRIYTSSEAEALAEIYPQFDTHTVSIYKDFYLGPISFTDYDDAERFNHSCHPNAGIKGQIVVVARTAILPGDEICIDYDTTEVKATPFNCNCGASDCRRVIDGTAWRDKQFQKKNQGYLSWYIEEAVKREKVSQASKLGRPRILKLGMRQRLSSSR